MYQIQSNETYELPQRNYINYVNDPGPMFYDSPRHLAPRNNQKNEHEKEDMHSPNDCDSDSVFADDDDFDHNTSSELSKIVTVTKYFCYRLILFIVLDTSKKSRPSDSSADIDMTVTQKFTKIKASNDNKNTELPSKAPPRPPKPSHIVGSSGYLKPSSSPLKTE